MKKIAAGLCVAMAFSFLVAGCASKPGTDDVYERTESRYLFDTGHDMSACRPDNYDTQSCRP